MDTKLLMLLPLRTFHPTHTTHHFGFNGVDYNWHSFHYKDCWCGVLRNPSSRQDGKRTSRQHTPKGLAAVATRESTRSSDKGARISFSHFLPCSTLVDDRAPPNQNTRTTLRNTGVSCNFHKYKQKFSENEKRRCHWVFVRLGTCVPLPECVDSTSLNTFLLEQSATPMVQNRTKKKKTVGHRRTTTNELRKHKPVGRTLERTEYCFHRASVPSVP